MVEGAAGVLARVFGVHGGDVQSDVTEIEGGVEASGRLQSLALVVPLDPHARVVHGLDAALQVHVLALVKQGVIGLRRRKDAFIYYVTRKYIMRSASHTDTTLISDLNILMAISSDTNPELRCESWWLHGHVRDFDALVAATMFQTLDLLPAHRVLSVQVDGAASWKRALASYTWLCTWLIYKS